MTPLISTDDAPLLPRPAPGTPAARPPRPSAVRVMFLLTGAAFRRMSNQRAVGFALFGRKKGAEAPPAARRATPRKRGSIFWLYLILVPCLLGGSALQSYGLTQRLIGRFGSGLPAAADAPPSSTGGGAAEAAAPETESPAFRPWPAAPDDRAPASAVGLVLLLFGLGCLASQLGAGRQELGQVEWDMEWLFTFPVPARTLFLARLVQYGATGPFTLMFWFIILPGLTVLYALAGLGWWTLPLALASAVYGAALIASACLAVEVWAQKQLTPAGRKNLQAGFGLIGGVFLFLGLLAVTQDRFDPLIVGAVRGLPWAAWLNPLSLPAWLAAGGWPAPAAASAMALIGVAAPLSAASVAGRMVRGGLVAAPGAPAARRAARGAVQPRIDRRLGGVVGKELRLLTRDRAFLTQTLILPVVLFTFEILMNWHGGLGLVRDPRHAAMTAFALGAYVLCFSAFHVLSAEGGATWMLYTFPRRLPSILQEKALLWGGLASLYAGAVLGIAVLFGMPLGAGALLTGVLAVGGVMIYAYMAAAIGTLATNPLEAATRRKVRLDLIYAFMLLASLYTGVIYAPTAWGQLVQAFLSALIALALWQKVQDRIPYLMEPAEAPPRRLSLADGLIAVQAFFTVQTALLAGLEAGGCPLSPGGRVLIATGVAGALAGSASLFFLRRVPGFLGLVGLLAPAAGPRPAARSVLLSGAAAGVAAGLFGVAYLAAVGRIGFLRPWAESLAAVPSPWTDPCWFGWVVLAAPLFEEFLFRGLIYRGMERSTRPSFAVLGSAAIFAAAHPAYKVVPVFVLGVACALAFRRSRMLWASVLTHVIYNVVVTLAAGMM